MVERADLDPNVHVILVSGRGAGFCAGFDLSAYAEGSSSAGGGSPYRDTVLSGRTQAVNHLPDQPWDPMIDYQMMSRFVRGFASLMHADKPTVVKIHATASQAARTSRFTPIRSSPRPTPRSVTRPPGCGEFPPPGCGPTVSVTNAPNAFC